MVRFFSFYRPCVLGSLLAFATFLAQGQTAQTTAPAAQVVLDSARYRLSPGDIVEIRHAFNPELNEQAQIRPDGRISLPLIGEIEIANKTIQDTVAILEARYAKEVRTPRITIQVRGFAALKIYVTGEVFRPGALGLPGPMTLLEAISEAGGIKHTGNPSMIVLIRKTADGKPQGKKLALYIKGQLAADAATLLRPFDVVMVPESKIARLDRWVDQHIRQLIPINASMGFTYLMSSQTGGIPIF